MYALDNWQDAALAQNSTQQLPLNFSFYDNYVCHYRLEKSLFYSFCLSANQHEFLKAQTPFYKAVEAFPRFLCAVAARITASKERLLLIENLWQEHGEGQAHKFHTQSFKTYLKALGAQEDLEPEKINNIFVSAWIDKTFALCQSLSPAQACAYLAGIEYIYTKVSRAIVSSLSRFTLVCEQTHYQTHEQLDYTHAQDLLQVAYSLDNLGGLGLQSAFQSSIDDFIDMLNQLSFLSEKEIQKIAQEPIAFYYSREDYKVELSVLQKINKKTNLNILTVCSGGEHVIQLASRYPSSRIVALDINASQLNLTKEKIKILSHSSLPLVLNEGKFELLFAQLQRKLSLADIQTLGNSSHQNYVLACDKLKAICEDIFSNHNLENIFTKEATRYSTQSFAKHFYSVFLSQIKTLSCEANNIKNVLGISLPQYYPRLSSHLNIEYFHGDFFAYFKTYNDMFDLISVSNIGDWQSVEQFNALLNTLVPHLQPKGALVARKLLGDYDLYQQINERLLASYLKDETNFYTECVVGYK